MSVMSLNAVARISRWSRGGKHGSGASEPGQGTSELSQTPAYQGIALLDVLLGSPGWVPRRVDKIEFLDAHVLKRRQSVDLIVPIQAPLMLRGTQVVATLPVALAGKESLVAFDLRGEGGESLPLLSSKILDEWLVEGLLAWVVTRPDNPIGDLTPEIDAEIRTLVSHAPEHRDVYERWRALGDAPRATSGTSAEEQRRALRSNTETWRVIGLLALRYPIVIEVPNDVGRHRVIKFAYEFWGPSIRALHRQVGRPGLPLAARLTWRLEKLGLKDKVAHIAGEIGLESIYHFEVEAPPGVQLLGVTVLDKQAASALERENNIKPRRVAASRGGAPHVQVRVDSAIATSRWTTQVSMRAAKTGWFRASFLVVLLSTLLICGGWTSLGTIGRDGRISQSATSGAPATSAPTGRPSGRPGQPAAPRAMARRPATVSERPSPIPALALASAAQATVPASSPGDADTAATLLFALVGAAATFLTRPQPHPMVERLTPMARWLTALTVLDSAVAAGSLIAFSRGPVLTNIWRGLGVSMLLFSIVFVAVWWLPWARHVESVLASLGEDRNAPMQANPAPHRTGPE